MSKKVHEVPHIPALSRCEPVSPRNTRKSSLKDTERKRKKLEKMRNSPKGDQKYLKSFVSFRVFREIRVRTRLLPFASFFSVLSAVRSEPGSVHTFRKSKISIFFCLCVLFCLVHTLTKRTISDIFKKSGEKFPVPASLARLTLIENFGFVMPSDVFRERLCCARVILKNFLAHRKKRKKQKKQERGFLCTTCLNRAHWRKCSPVSFGEGFSVL